MNVDFLNKQCYRIAFIGRTSSGKTCILASLGLGRSAKSRLTSSFRPLDFPLLTDDEKQRLDTDKDVRLRWNFQIGEQRLQEAMNSLKGGKRPAATERSANVRPMLEFQLGDSEGRGDFFVWTEDYPGELLNVEELKVENSEAQVLKQRLLQYDGLILVVDTVVTEEQRESVSRDIENLSGFFACLAEDMKSGKAKLSQIPIAIVLSKWDRYSKSIQFISPDEERKKLEEYLKQNPMYDSLIKTIRSNAQQQEAEPTGDLMAGIAYGNTAVFPVSSFGKSVEDSVEGERPDESNRFSFGIVDPFFWLACRSDDLNIDRLEKTYNSTWKWNPVKVSPIRNEVVRLSNRINGATDTKKRYSSLIEKCNAASSKLWCGWILAFVFLGLLGYGRFWSYRVSSWESIIGAPSTTVEQLTDMRQKLDNYKTLFFKGLFAPSTTRVEDDINNVDIRIDDLIWNPANNAQELPKKAEFAQAYVNKLPNGPHAKEAWAIINEFNAEKEKRVWETIVATKDLADQAKQAQQYLADFNGDGNAIHAVEAKNIIEQHKNAIEESVWKGVEDAIQYSENQRQLAQDYIIQYPEGKHVEDANRLIKLIDEKRNWDKALAHYNEVKNNESIPKLLQELQDLISVFEITPERCLPLITEVPKVVESKLNALSASTTEFNMIGKCDETLMAIKSFEDVLRGKNENSLADSIVNSYQFVKKYKSEQIDMYDRKLYENVRNSKTKDVCNNYHNKMESFGGGAMASYVSEYKSYLESKDTIQDNVQVVCRLYWGPQTPANTKIKSALHIGNKDFTSDIRSFAADTRDLGSATLNGINPKEDKIKISVKLVSDGNWYNWNDVVYGEGEDSFYLSELMGSTGRSISLRDDRNGKFNARLDVTASAPGMSSEPELPKWTKK